MPWPDLVPSGSGYPLQRKYILDYSLTANKSDWWRRRGSGWKFEKKICILSNPPAIAQWHTAFFPLIYGPLTLFHLTTAKVRMCLAHAKGFPQNKEVFNFQLLFHAWCSIPRLPNCPQERFLDETLLYTWIKRTTDKVSFGKLSSKFCHNYLVRFFLFYFIHKTALLPPSVYCSPASLLAYEWYLTLWFDSLSLRCSKKRTKLRGV